jgi:hypothetical protein
MTETISNTNAAASILFLGHNGEWWDFWLIVSVIAAALVATAIGVTTAGSIISHKRETIAAEKVLELEKLETGKQIAEANARQKEAELKLAQLRQLAGPRGINFDVFKKEMEGKTKAPVAIWYLPDVSDAWNFAFRLQIALGESGWEIIGNGPEAIAEPDQNNMFVRDMPRAMAAGVVVAAKADPIFVENPPNAPATANSK